MLCTSCAQRRFAYMSTTDLHARLHLYVESVSSALANLPDALVREVPSIVHLLVNARQILAIGVGKSGVVATKFAATLMSIGYQARSMNAVDILHGDVGVVMQSDVAVLISKSGETKEMLAAEAALRKRGAIVVALVGKEASTLAKRADVVLLLPTGHELDSDGVLPTTSVLTAMAACDFIVMEVLLADTDAASKRLVDTHPGGTIGNLLHRTVGQIMHSGERLPSIKATGTISDALIVLSTTALGIVCILDEASHVLGVITDGDVRRLALQGELQLLQSAHGVMNPTPTTVSVNATLHEALMLMERRERQISVLPVVDNNKCVGVIRLHDIVSLQV